MPCGNQIHLSTEPSTNKTTYTASGVYTVYDRLRPSTINAVTTEEVLMLRMRTSSQCGLPSPFGASLIAVLLIFGATEIGNAQAPTTPPGQVTFAKDVAPILQRSCQTCHRPGNIGPMSLLTYQDVRPWARAIKLQVSQRNMPPWYISRTIGIQKFKNDPSLTDREIALISRWVDNGAPLG